MDSYDITTSLEEHIENTEIILDYLKVRETVKCRLLITIPQKGAMLWYVSLRKESIDS
jgi:hypothetical protein